RSGSWRVVSARRRSSLSSDANANEPNPQQASRRNSRRSRVGRTCGISVHVQKGVQVEHGQGELAERMVVEEFRGELPFATRRRPARGERVRQLNLPIMARAGFALQPPCKCL